MKIYGDTQSGNCYKIQLLCHLLNIQYEWVPVDIMAGDTRTKRFLALNPNGKVPIIQLDNGEVLAESNAILNYLAHGTSYYPDDALQQALIQQWQFFEQYSHEPFIAVARYINVYLGLPEHKRGEYEAKQAGGHKALAVMESQLSKTPFLIGDSPSTADIALYGYTHVAHEGGFDLSRYPSIKVWLQRIAGLPGYQAMIQREGAV